MEPSGNSYPKILSDSGGSTAGAAERRQVPFLVRGAPLACSSGTHTRRLNLPLCHGVYAGGHPLAHKGDCQPGANISPFGICRSATPPPATKGQTITLPLEDANGVVRQVTGQPCLPMILGKWRCCHPSALIATNESLEAAGDDPFKRVYAEALTTESFLVCDCDGLIEPLESGQSWPAVKPPPTPSNLEQEWRESAVAEREEKSARQDVAGGLPGELVAPVSGRALTDICHSGGNIYISVRQIKEAYPSIDIDAEIEAKSWVLYMARANGRYVEYGSFMDLIEERLGASYAPEIRPIEGDKQKVREIQLRLNYLYYGGQRQEPRTTYGLEVDGDLGDNTKNSLRLFMETMGLPPADMDTCGMMGVYTYNILFSDAARKHKDRPIFPEEFPELLGIDISDWQYPLDTINGRKRNCEDKFYFAIGEQNGDPWTGMSQFGWIRTDKYGNHRTHAAIDLYGEVGEPVYAMAKGIVTRILPTGYYEGTGQIIIAHKNDKNQEKYLSARYSEINVDYDNDKTLNVKTLRVGDNVEAGQIIGHQMIPTGNMVMVHLEIYCGFKPADTNIILAPKGNHGSYHRDDTLMYPMWVYYLPASPNHNIKTL